MCAGLVGDELLLALCVLCGLASGVDAQEPPLTGPQQLAFAGLRAVANEGQINAVQTDASGNLYLLIDRRTVCGC